jgi:hypothetical protein
MHSKYIVRDPQGEGAAVWTGSTNFTDAASTRQENDIITIADTQRAQAHRADSDQLWARHTIGGTGRGGGGDHQVGGGTLGWDFFPGDGQAINSSLADRISTARRRVIVGSVVLASPEGTHRAPTPSAVASR